MFKMFQLFQSYVAASGFMLQVASVIFWMFHVFHTHIASTCSKCFIRFQTYVVFKYFYVISILCCLSRGQLDWACGARAGGQWCCGRGGVCTLGVHKGNDPSGIPTMLLLTRSRLRLCLEPSSHGHHASDKMPPRPVHRDTNLHVTGRIWTVHRLYPAPLPAVKYHASNSVYSSSDFSSSSLNLLQA